MLHFNDVALSPEIAQVPYTSHSRVPLSPWDSLAKALLWRKRKSLELMELVSMQHMELCLMQYWTSQLIAGALCMIQAALRRPKQLWLDAGKQIVNQTLRRPLQSVCG